jgi:osmotically-inducible protein OsmY
MNQIKEDRRPSEIQRPARMPSMEKNEKEIIQAEAQSRLQKSPYQELWNVACDFQEGVLTLRGCVPSFFLKQVAQSIVFVMERVEKINNHLEVVTR